jgi:hypothetical protein
MALAAFLVVLTVLPFTAPFATFNAFGHVGDGPVAARLVQSPGASIDEGALARRHSHFAASGRTLFVVLFQPWTTLPAPALGAGFRSDTVAFPCSSSEGRLATPLRI